MPHGRSPRRGPASTSCARSPCAHGCGGRHDDRCLRRGHIYGTTGRISIPIAFNIPPDRPTEVHVTTGGDPPVAPATEVLRFPTADPRTAEAEEFASAILDRSPVPVPPTDAVANLRVIEAPLATG